MITKIIGIAGPARAGKDTFAALLTQEGVQATIVSLATPMKKMLMLGLDLSYEQVHGHDKESIDPRYGVSARYLMQTLGTQWGRELVHTDLWLTILKNTYEGIIIVPDIRFENEATFVRRHGVLIHIKRDIGGIESDHASEKGVSNLHMDYLVNNNTSLASLEDKARLITGFIHNEWGVS